MKKEYVKPLAEIIEFVSKECIMDEIINPGDNVIGDSGTVEEW